MRISQDHGNFFYFSFEEHDYQIHGRDYIQRFINVIRKEFPGGRNAKRYWLKEMKCWAIHKDCRGRFRILLEQYFDINKQGVIL